MRSLRLLSLLFLVFLPLFTTVTQAGTLVKLTTTKGVIVVELNDKKAPLTVQNFLTYVDKGYYNNTVFHRVIKGFMIQGGGFDRKYRRKRTRARVRNESNNGLSNRRGTLAMARMQDPDSAAAQFFINQADNSNLDYPRYGGYTVFGRVTQGLDVVDAIAAAPTSTRHYMRDVPTEDIILQRAERLKP
ncbi:MAG TPA: peptidyl-prolyl cis-trans isomerase [Gammaproteobacteria bacterium]|nr:peptidyl-prolyl cis-trans isomerase [Gammaproteobacteria bacterium]